MLVSFLREALRDFYQRHHTLPIEVVVTRSQVAAALSALKELDLEDVPVATTGGCLWGEVWLGVSDEDEPEE